MHHLIFVHHHVDGAKCITDLLDLCGQSVTQIPPCQTLLSSWWSCNALQVPPSILQRLCIFDVVEHLITHTRREAIQESDCCFLPSWKVSVRQFQCYIIRSFHITLVSVAEKILLGICLSCGRNRADYLVEKEPTVEDKDESKKDQFG